MDTFISPGDVVWMRMWVLSGYNLFSKEQFIYDPNSTQYATYSAEGTTMSDSLTFKGLSTSARASAGVVAQPAMPST